MATLSALSTTSFVSKPAPALNGENSSSGSDQSVKKVEQVAHKDGQFVPAKIAEKFHNPGAKRKLDSDDSEIPEKRRKLEGNPLEDKPNSGSAHGTSSQGSHSHSHSHKKDDDMNRRKEQPRERGDDYHSHSSSSSSYSSGRDRYEGKSNSFSRGERNEERRNSHAHDPKLHYLPMKGTIYLDYIKSGVKKYEGRVHGTQCASMRVGDQLKLYDNKARKGIVCEILSKDVYKTFEEMLKAKGVFELLPQLKKAGVQQNQQDLIKEGVRIYQAFPGSNRVHQYGVAAIGVKYLKDV